MNDQKLFNSVSWCFVLLMSVFRPAETTAQFPPAFPQPQITDTIVHEGDLVISGSDIILIENTDFSVNGNVYLSDNAQLILRQSVLRIFHYPRQEMFVDDNAQVHADTSIFFDLVHAFFNNSSQLIMNNCLFINLLQFDGQSVASISNSYIFSEPFGLLQPGEQSDLTIHNSIIGAIGLNLPENLVYNIDNLVPGFYTYWSAQSVISPALDYNLVMTDTEVKDNPGYSGGFEMGWNLMTGSNVDLTINNSTLNKLIIGFMNEDVTFSGLLTRQPVDFSYKDIFLINTTIQNQWGIFVDNGETTITNSEGIWLWPVGNKGTFVSQTAVNEFDPRDFSGTVTMEECTMNDGFEVYSNCDFRLEGGIRLTDTDPLWDQSSQMTRNYRVQLFNDLTGAVMPGIALALEKDGNVIWRDTSDLEGWVHFDITFDLTTHLDNWQLVSEDSIILLDKDMNIRSFTPHLIRLEPTDDNIHLRQVVYVDDSNPFPGTGIPDDPFRDIQEAVDHCSRKGIVRVAKGTYPCSVTMADEIFILGAGPDSTLIEDDVFAWDVVGSRITGFRIDDGKTAGIHCYHSELTITNNVITGQPHNGIHSAHSNLTLINNTITGNGLNGLFFIDSSFAEIRNNIIAGNGGLGIHADQAGLVELDYNDFWLNAEGNYGNEISPGANDISSDPMFNDPGSGDYQLQEGSPCIDAGDPDSALNDPGGSRNDMGAFGGPYSNSPGQALKVQESTPPGNNFLLHIYPNPITSIATLSFSLKKPSTITIQIFTSQGQLIEEIHQEQSQGEQQIQWNAQELPAGMYYFRVQAGDMAGGGKMVKLNSQ